ncbi:MAG: 50S ribosome-binding GTPase [Verrucomicrobia bacterium]|nr:50S ribosome-binding GTPase [Verrucomicrobiota bacterium]
MNNDIELQPSSSACGGCRSCAVNMRQLGIDAAKFDYVVALAGNPNTGKSTVFNRLTGLKQHTGNWPGKTVTRAEGGFEYEGGKYKLVDLPGTYSLLSASVDEEVARDFILFGRPDCVVTVVDATVLERNLNLVLQVMEITDRVVVCLNLMDEAKRKGMDIDHRSLARELGVPVIPTIARTGSGFSQLLQAVTGVINGSIATSPRKISAHGRVKDAVDELSELVGERFPGLPNARWVAMRLLDGDVEVKNAVDSGELAALAEGLR